ncbi:IMPA1 monophosphatase, partial [Polypterus senegalus]|nr:IMPA1 monophosphatase [Polypterus senegalus]
IMTAFKGVWTRQFWTSMAGEFLAVFIFLVVSLGCTVNLKDQATPGPSTTHIALCFGFSIAILIHCFGHICEAYLNPAVAVAMVCTKKISMAKGLFYIVAQCVSALAAAGTVALVTPHSKWPVAVTQVNENLSAGQALLVEVFITFQLVFTIFASCDSKRKDIKVPIPLIIGLSVTIGHLFAIPYTGASMNPARSLGVAVVFNSWHNHWLICEALRNEVSFMTKSSPVDLVTETDKKVEAMIISSIKKKFETHRFPFVAVSIGFAVQKELEFGIIYSCLEDKMYTARKGKGAFCNGVQLKVSQQQDITKSLVITEIGYKQDPHIMELMLSNMERILGIPAHGIRAVGTAAVNMCLVACGGADAYYHIGIHCWDMAAGVVIVTEAGGVVLDITGGPFDLMSRRLIAASSRAVGERIAKEIQAFPCGRDDKPNNLSD